MEEVVESWKKIYKNYNSDIPLQRVKEERASGREELRGMGRTRTKGRRGREGRSE